MRAIDLYLQSEANQSQDNFGDDLEARVGQNQRLELVRLSDVLSNVLLQILDPVEPQHEPDLQRAESTAEWDLPMLQLNIERGRLESPK